jgi:8-oxo-dGTP pyrophosphatase MutT (NUDIX family)
MDEDDRTIRRETDNPQHVTTALIPIRGIDLRITENPWHYAKAHRDEIETYWQQAVARNPHIWNGTVLIGHHAAINNGRLEGKMARTDFASVIAWRGLKHQDDSRHVFGMPGILTSDGAIVFAVMADHTYNAGRIYPPGGSLDLNDILEDGSVDVLGSIAREMKEETGLDSREAESGDLYVVPIERAITVVQFLHFPSTARELESRVSDFLNREKTPELKGLWIVRTPADIVSEMSGFAIEMAKHALSRRVALTLP